MWLLNFPGYDWERRFSILAFFAAKTDVKSMGSAGFLLAVHQQRMENVQKSLFTHSWNSRTGGLFSCIYLTWRNENSHLERSHPALWGCFPAPCSNRCKCSSVQVNQLCFAHQFHRGSSSSWAVQVINSPFGYKLLHPRTLKASLVGNISIFSLGGSGKKPLIKGV